MNWSKTIFLLTFIAISLICTKAIAIDGFTKVLGSTTVESQKLPNAQDKYASFTNGSLLESFFLKTPTHTITPKVEERNTLTDLFLSFFPIEQVKRSYGNLYSNLQLQFIPHALKIIYPHHHFW